MKGINFFTDPHLGKNLVANTTPESRARMTDDMFNRVNIREFAVNPTMCLGDLFDKFDNSARVVMQGSVIAGFCKAVLGGNHDFENRKDSYSSLDLLSDMSVGGVMVRPEYGVAVAGVVLSSEDATVVMVPHHCDQELFMQALDKACAYTTQGTSFLLLHCNYDCDHITNDIALNLDKPTAIKLLEHFDYILIGHDHNAKTDFDGRLHVIGSANPTCFGDCHVDHGYLFWDAETKELERKVLWSAAEKYLEIDASDFIAADVILGYDFIRVTGRVSSAQVPDLSRKVKSVWKSDSPPYALRVDATVVVDAAATDAESAEQGKPISFFQKVESSIEKDPELLAIWNEITAELKGEG